MSTPENDDRPDMQDVFDRHHRECDLPGLGAVLLKPYTGDQSLPTSSGDVEVFVSHALTLHRVTYDYADGIARYDAATQTFTVDPKEAWARSHGSTGTDAACKAVAKLITDGLNGDAQQYARLSQRMHAARFYLDAREAEIRATERARKLRDELDQALAQAREAAAREREARPVYLASLGD